MAGTVIKVDYPELIKRIKVTVKFQRRDQAEARLKLGLWLVKLGLKVCGFGKITLEEVKNE